jgi:hypothetical protein
MNRQCGMALFLVSWLVACGQPGGKPKEDSAKRNSDFSLKRFCAQAARTHLAEDKQAPSDSGLRRSIHAEWCYSKRLNTCIYSKTEVLTGNSQQGRAAEPPPMVVFRETIDLLTNRPLASVPFSPQNPEATSAEYDRKKGELFKECL